MGLIKSGGLVIASVLLLLSLIVGNLFLTLDKSLEYEIVESELTSTIKELANQEFNLTKEINTKIEIMDLFCENNSNYVFKQGDLTFDISCESVAFGTDAVIEEGINELVEDTYNKDYNCGFIDCFGEGPPFFIVSKQTQDYASNKFQFFLLISLVLVVLIFFLIQSKTNLPIVVGILIIISSLPFMRLDWFLSLFLDKMYLGVLTFLFTKSSEVFIITLLLGAAVLIIGIILKFFVVGFRISDFFNRVTKKDEKDNKKMNYKEKIQEYEAEKKNKLELQLKRRKKKKQMLR